ncbi:MAG: hypothetical protein H0V09_10410 [Gemmatimonadetes bacterium]|nr:hypothetical protein [Gemmatimonadota bacterium]
MKVNVAAEARDAGLTDALVFVTESWGSRMLASARGLGVPPSLAERAYRRVDHCAMDELLREAHRDGAAPAEVKRRLERLMRTARGARKLNLAGDPTLRLAPGILPERCAEELRYDRLGFDVFTPHLPENSPHLESAVVVARDLREQNAELMAAYPGKAAYVYRNGRFAALR